MTKKWGILIKKESESLIVTGLKIPRDYSIGWEAFCGRDVRTVIIPEGVTEIKESAFEDCKYLKEVVIPKSVKTIGASAFNTCTRMDSVVISHGVTEIGSRAFADCDNLREIILPDSVKTMERSVFNSCDNLETVKLPGQIEYLPEGAFGGCVALTEIQIPESVKELGNGIFSNCSRLKTVNIPKEVMVIPSQMFYGCIALEEVVIPEGVTDIGWEAFYVCKSLKNIVFPESLFLIASSAFYECESLESITIPNRVSEIGYEVFYNCKNLKSAIILNERIGLEGNAWYGNPNLVFYSKNGDNTYEYAIERSFTWRDIDILGIYEDIIELETETFAYNGLEHQPSVSLTYANKKLELGTDYTLEYSNNINAGTATVTVKGIGNYTGVVKKSFTIQAKGLTSLVIKTTKYTYSGKANKPEVIVKSGTNILLNNKDYVVTYSNNVNPGTATVTVRGTGNYIGSIKKTYKIDLPKVANLKQSTAYTTSKIVMTWNKVTGASGYAVYRATSKNSSYKFLKSVMTNVFTNAGLKSESKYYYKVCAYKTVNGKKIYGAYSDVKSMLTKPGAPTGFAVTLKSRTAKITWAKVSGAQGYEVYMSSSRNGSYTRIILLKCEEYGRICLQNINKRRISL